MDKKKNRFYLHLSKEEWLLLLVVLYAVVSVTMNIFANKPLSFGLPFIVMDGGLLISWLAFAVPNVIYEVYGKKMAEFSSWLVAIFSFTLFIIGFAITKIPTLNIYSEQAEHFSYIFDNGIRVIVSSFIAFIVGQYININIIDAIKVKIKKDNNAFFFFRAFISSVFGQLIDNFLFQFLAFAPIGLSLYEMGYRDIFTAVLSSTIIEVVIESIFIMPFTQTLSTNLQRIGKK